jgi:hypothetical protein
VIRWTGTLVNDSVVPDMDRLLAPWFVGRPENYAMGASMRLTLSVGAWLDEQLATICNDADRKTQGWKYNRLSRSQDPLESAAECLNEALAGTVEQNRVPHKRWG